MKKHLFLLAFTVMPAFAEEPAFTPEQLAHIAISDNPELRFYEKQVAALPKPLQVAAPEIAQPLAFPGREVFRRAVLNLDADLARLYLAEFRFVLAGEVRLKAMEFEAATESAATAGDLANRITALVKMLEQRPAAGVESLIERRILEGAALPFVRQAAESSMRAKLIHTQLNGLLGRKPDAPLRVAGSFELPPETAAQNPAGSLLLKIREAEIARGLAGLDAASAVESFAVGGWFTREGLGTSEAVEGVTRPGGTSGATFQQTRERLIDDARRKMTRETSQRQTAVQAAREVVNAIPPKLIENLQSASDLAERQYR
ncbi:MAG: hypothetical protein WC378_20765, partial [Opitutaceae bacterium]